MQDDSPKCVPIYWKGKEMKVTGSPIIGDPCLGELWPLRQLKKHHRSPRVRIASGGWPMAGVAFSSSLVWAINNSDASSWISSNNPSPCLLQPLPNEFRCHLSCHYERKHWKTLARPRSDLKDTFNESKSTEVMVLSFVFVFLFMLIPLCLAIFFFFFFSDCYWFLKICKFVSTQS